MRKRCLISIKEESSNPFKPTRVFAWGWACRTSSLPQHGWEAWVCILMRGGGAKWKSRHSDVKEERKETGRGGSCYLQSISSSFQTLLLLLVSTHILVSRWWSTSNRTTKGPTVREGGVTAGRTGSAASKKSTVFSISAAEGSISHSGGKRHRSVNCSRR